MATAAERLVWVQMLTTLGWMLAAVRVPARSTLLRLLCGPARFLPLGEVATPWRAPGAAPLSVHKEHVLAVVPQAEERVAPSPVRGRGAVHQVTLLLRGGQVSGEFEMARGAAPAAFLQRAPRFVVVEKARLRFASSPRPASNRVGLVIVNVDHVAGLRSRAPREA